MSANPRPPAPTRPPQAGGPAAVADTGGPGLTACHLGGPFGYVDEPPITGVCTTQHPFPARVDLGALT